MKKKTTDVILEDQTLREGLQAESKIFDLKEKQALFNQLRAAGLNWIQVGSFVHPQVLPQMANTDLLIRQLNRVRKPDETISTLVLNAKGLERALACGVGHVNLSVSVSNSHSLKNAGQSASLALASMAEVVSAAKEAGIKLRAGLQCVFGCVYEGHIPVEKVLSSAEALIEAGARDINLADTTGMADPQAVSEMVASFNKQFPGIGLSLHLHNTRGLGLTNMWSGYTAGVRHFDVCTGGLGGCPFVKGAAGNIPTEDAVNMFESMGIRTGIDLMAVCEIVSHLESMFGRSLPGHMKRVLAVNKDL